MRHRSGATYMYATHGTIARRRAGRSRTKLPDYKNGLRRREKREAGATFRKGRKLTAQRAIARLIGGTLPPSQRESQVQGKGHDDVTNQANRRGGAPHGRVRGPPRFVQG
jgi:hypothetical protein